MTVTLWSFDHVDGDVWLTVTVTLYLGFSGRRLDDDWLTATYMVDGDGDAVVFAHVDDDSWLTVTVTL